MFSRHYLLLIFAAFVLFVAGPSAAQQAPKVPTPVIGVINFDGVARESAAGRDVAEQVNAQRKIFQTEFQSITAQLEQSRQELSRQQTILAPDVFAEKRKEFETNARQVQEQVRRVQKQLELMLTDGMKQVRLELVSVIQEISKERGLNMILNAGTGLPVILYTDKELDISEEALKRLNTRVTKIILSNPTDAKPQAPGTQNPSPKQ